MNANVQQLQQIGNKVKMELNGLQKHSSKLFDSLDQFNAMIQILDGKAVVIKRPGRPKKNASANIVVVKRGPGRPKKNVEDVVATNEVTEQKRRGRPRKVQEEESVVTTAVGKRGRPRKTESATNEVVATSGGRGRPSVQDILAEGLTPELKGDLKRIEENVHHFNKWWEESTKDKEVWKIENGSYLGVIEGFYSSGTSGRFGVTTRIYVNPNSNLVPEELKNNINTTAVNRIRYVDNKEEGISYIEKQKVKLAEDFFSEVLPKVIKDHGKKGSVYAFHLDSDVRRKFNKIKVIYDNKYATKIEKQLVKS
jgi:hypothetical protein